MKKITVCIADMDVGYRASLRKALESSGSVEVVADAGDGLAALEAVETLHPQVLLTDTLLPGLDGLGLLRRIRGKGTRTIVITSAVMDNTVQQARQAGHMPFCPSRRTTNRCWSISPEPPRLPMSRAPRSWREW